MVVGINDDARCHSGTTLQAHCPVGKDGRAQITFLNWSAGGTATDAQDTSALGWSDGVTAQIAQSVRNPNPGLGELVPVDDNNAAWTTANVYLYTGEQFDPDLGFYYLRARYHYPDTGRFWAMDEYEGKSRNPLSLHKYSYCHDNPANGVDPSGHAVYFVERPLDDPSGQGAWPGVGHGYLLFTAPDDPGTDDPIEFNRTRIRSFSWHPWSWNYRRSERVPGRVWENHPLDMTPALHRSFLVTANEALQTVLLNYVNSWIQAAQPGHDLGAPLGVHGVDFGNEIGQDAHVPALPTGVYYSWFEQNCVWWVTIMLRQSNIPVPPLVYTEIGSFNAGVGGGPEIVRGRRSASDVWRLGVPARFSMPLTLDIPIFAIP